MKLNFTVSKSLFRIIFRVVDWIPKQLLVERKGLIAYQFPRVDIRIYGGIESAEL